MEVSKKTRSFQMTGDEELRPGIGTFHRMFFVSLHSTGGVAVVDTPVARGPRHCPQNRSAPACSACNAGTTGDNRAAAVRVAAVRRDTRTVMMPMDSDTIPA